ncbi:OmpA family protein [Larkinella sp. C7]|jgi:outer membrane protein OmpA-like peptidoglycan-associated protein|uniref:OmpA family protein n=1 Tax=Larkinella sp. C7 TaxID=2576607 RepID=UPI001E60B467|nr:PA14 domain-containing protein [Larkinella sp. C7]
MVARCLIGGMIGLFVMQSANGQSKATAGNGLKGDYFDGTNFERKVFTRMDPQIDFNWEGSRPGPGLGRSYYSVRWTGKLYAPTTGVYKFTATVDDGIRLWIGGKKVIDVWRLNDNQTFRGDVYLKAGQYYDLRVDFFNDPLGGSISLFWIPPNQTTPSPVTGNYLFRPDFQPPKPVAPKVVPKVAPKMVPKPVVVKPNVRPAVARKPPVVRTTPKDTVARVTIPVKTPERFEGLKTGDKLVLNQVFFAQSEYRLLPESYAELDKLVRTMTQSPTLQIEISGHTDNVGDPRLNLALSENRAKVITTYLVRNGVADGRIATKGYGGTRPIADNTTEEGRAKNRRVEFSVK